MNDTTTARGPVWRELGRTHHGGRVLGGERALTADLPGDVTLWIEFRPERTPRWTVDVARGNAWVARNEDGGPTLATSKRRAMGLAAMRRAEMVR